MADIPTAEQYRQDAIDRAVRAHATFEEVGRLYQFHRSEFEWAMAHPALPEGFDPKSPGLAPEPIDDREPTPAPEVEAPKKRTRRTKEQIAADKAREEAARAELNPDPGPPTDEQFLNPPTNESDTAAETVEAQGISGAFQNTAGPFPAPPPYQPGVHGWTPPPVEPSPAASDDFNPFGQG